MHELAITQSLLALALEHAEAAGARRITDLHLVIGELSSVVDECVQFYWEMVSQDSIAAGSRLHFRRVPALLTCQDCGAQNRWADIQAVCPACGGSRLQLCAGDEFHLDSIDIEGEAVAASGAPA